MENTRLVKSKFDDSINIQIKRKWGIHNCTSHGHDFFEIDMVLKGNAETILNETQLQAETGMIFFLTPEDFHSYPSNERLDMYNIQFSEDILSDEINALILNDKKRIFHPNEKNFANIKNIIEIMNSIKKAECKNVALLTKLLECILLIMFEETTGESTHNRKYEDMQKAILYIHAHFKENPSLSEVSEVVYLNPNYFCKKFLEYTGQTYKQYLTTTKLRYAKRLIMVSSMSMLEIAADCGYTSQSHFNREFKELFGVSPLQFRKIRK